MKKTILLFVFLFVSTITFSQLVFSYYEIEYNESTDLFDCKMFIESGSATTAADRLQLSAQYSIIVETGTTIAVAETYLPIYNNESYTGTVPMDWEIENMAIDPMELPGYDVFGIVPNIGGQPAHYNNLNAGDEITLFSLSAVGGDICSISLRIFENDVDPTSIGSGTDFSNSMMVGSTTDVYSGNFISNDVWQDIDVTVNQGEICEGDCITLVPSFNCIFPGLEYVWSTGENTESITVCPEVSQSYVLNLSGPFEFSMEIVSYVDVDNGIWADGELITELCVGVPIFYLPEYGIWSSSDENIVTVNNDGYVTPISNGTAVISHTTASGDCLDQLEVTVSNPEVPMILGENEICAGESTQLSPSTGVMWTSENPAVASIDNSGLVTGIGLGSTVFTYTTDQGCVSEPSPMVTVLVIPEPKITGRDTICVYETSTLTPNSGVIWESSDVSVATIDNSGIVTAISEGQTTFYFTDMANGCTSDESEPLTVLPSPMVQLSVDTVCQGVNVTATTSSNGGTWISTVISGDPNLVFINQITGNIATLKPGQISVQYINAEGCISDDSVLLTILPKPFAPPASNSPICRGENLILSTTIPPGANYTYQWTGSNGFSSNQMNVTIPSADLNQIEVYFLTASENGCDGENFAVDVFIEDCDPCEDINSTAEWIKQSASMSNFTSIGDYEIGGSLVSGRELDDFVYYNADQEDVRLVKNTGDGYFEDEMVLFDLPYYGPKVRIDIVDIDQDGLNDIITYQSKTTSSTSNLDTLLFTIFNNKDNFSFESTLSVVGESGLGFAGQPVMYRDLDKEGFLDIIPYYGSVYFTDGWAAESVQMPTNSISLLTDDFNEDGYLDILRNNSQVYFNNGDRTFDLVMIEGSTITDPGLYDFETGVFYNGLSTYQISKGDIPFVENCNTLFLEGSNCFFTANINSSSVENGVISNLDGFDIFQAPMTCENIIDYESNFQFIPKENGKIDLTDNGFTDFITVENNQIFAWINPNDQPKLRGTAFIDNNGDGILNENDSPLRNVLISIEPGNLSVLTDDDGSYQFAVPEGTYTLTANVNEGEWIMDELTIENAEVDEPCNSGFDFGFVPEPTPDPMVNLSMVNTITRCDFEVKFTITVENIGTETLESQLQFDFDDKTNFFSTEIIGATVGGNKVTADIGPLTPFQPQKFEIKVKMPSGSSSLPMLDFKASLLSDAGEIIAEYGYAEQLRCSYDPNDKRGFPDREGDDNLTLMDEDIEYTIRFQNNGNDTAYTVKIIDPLDDNIDPSSIRVVGSSHRVETCIEGTDLIFLFENIYLVDSMTDYPSSQGYVTFKCNAKEGVAEMTAVHNTAEIIFDTNPPISTNQTLNTLVSELCTDKSTVIDMYICDGEEYMGQTESGTYTESFDLPYGCDSLVTLNLTVQGITYSQQSIDICGSLEIQIGPEVYFIDTNTVIVDTVINDQGCISNILKFEFTVVPDLIDIDELEFCIDEIGSVPLNLNGSWTVSDETVVILDDQGNITTVNSGTTTLQFLDYTSGCVDEIQIEVFPEPIISNDGKDQICINETNQFISDTEGTWISTNLDIATVTNDGLLMGTGEGTVTVTFTSLISGCTKSIEMIVLPASDSQCTVSTDDLSSESVNIYPNPATESLFIESKDRWNNARLINSQGQVVLSIGIAEYERKKQIGLSDVIPGLYFVSIERESGVVIKKIVVD